MTKSRQLSIRIEEDLAKRLDRATDTTKKPYAPSKSQVVARGIDLALKELESGKGK